MQYKMTYDDACQWLAWGWKAARVGWTDGAYITLSPPCKIAMFDKYGYLLSMPTDEDRQADDWRLVEL